MNENLLGLVADIVTAHVAANNVSANDVPTLITTVYQSLSQLAAPVEAPPEGKQLPAVSVKSSLKRDSIACLECGKKFKTIRRHIEGHGLSETEYRAKWQLPASYPMVSADYSAYRADMAKKIGLGGKPKSPTEN